MISGEKLVEIIDLMLKSQNISRRKFCAQLDIPESTVASWKFKNILPNTELMAKVAQYFNVSLDWLVYQEPTNIDREGNTLNNPLSRKSIVHRIECVLGQNHHDFNCAKETLPGKYLSNIVNPTLLDNWQIGRAYLPDDVLPKIAKEINVDLQWLLTGEEVTKDIESHLKTLAKKYQFDFYNFDCMTEEQREYTRTYMAQCRDFNNLKYQVEQDKKNTKDN